MSGYNERISITAFNNWMLKEIVKKFTSHVKETATIFHYKDKLTYAF
jgi:hypothetical protein